MQSTLYLFFPCLNFIRPILSKDHRMFRITSFPMFHQFHSFPRFFSRLNLPNSSCNSFIYTTLSLSLSLSVSLTTAPGVRYINFPTTFRLYRPILPLSIQLFSQDSSSSNFSVDSTNPTIHPNRSHSYFQSIGSTIPWFNSSSIISHVRTSYPRHHDASSCC